MTVLTSTKPAISVPHIEYLYLFSRGNKKPTKSSQKVSQHPKLWRVNWWCRREFFFLSLSFCFGLKMSCWKIGHDADKKDGMRLTRLWRRCAQNFGGVITNIGIWSFDTDHVWHIILKKDPIWIFSVLIKIDIFTLKNCLILQRLFELRYFLVVEHNEYDNEKPGTPDMITYTEDMNRFPASYDSTRRKLFKAHLLLAKTI